MRGCGVLSEVFHIRYRMTSTANILKIISNIHIGFLRLGLGLLDDLLLLWNRRLGAAAGDLI